jgi:hypothetical protein
MARPGHGSAAMSGVARDWSCIRMMVSIIMVFPLPHRRGVLLQDS